MKKKCPLKMDVFIEHCSIIFAVLPLFWATNNSNDFLLKMGYFGPTLHVTLQTKQTSGYSDYTHENLPSLKQTASLHLKMDAWETILSFWEGRFREGT